MSEAPRAAEPELDTLGAGVSQRELSETESESEPEGIPEKVDQGMSVRVSGSVQVVHSF